MNETTLDFEELFNSIISEMQGLLQLLSFVYVTTALKYPDYTEHPCIRPCDGVPRDCYYNLTFARYMTMQPDCRDCLNGVEEDCYREDCIPGSGTSKHVLTYNGLIPGPPLEFCQNDRIIVDVHNADPVETTTLHWHGLHQRGNLHMDGVPQVTQCPILPGTTFRYRFNATEKGTHWYHSHSGSQRADGAFGLMTINPTTEYHSALYDYDKKEHRISIMDWLDLKSDDHYYAFMRNKIFYDTNIKTLLINGFGKTRDNNLPYKKFYVDAGKKYRFRLVNTGNTVCPVVLTIDKHMLKVISTDGNDIQPLDVNSIKVANGERYDIVIDANQEPGTYAMRFHGTQNCNTSTIAILQYNSAPIVPPLFEPNDHKPGPIMANCIGDETDMICYNYNEMHSVKPVPPAISTEPTFRYIIGINMEHYVPDQFRGVRDSVVRSPFLNNITYMPSPTPLIFSANNNNVCDIQNKRNCEGPYCTCTHVVKIPLNAVTELVFVDEAQIVQITHPFHLHGLAFYVVAKGRPDETVHRTTTEIVRGMLDRNEIVRNLNAPPLKDTFHIPIGGYTIIRFVANNPGLWLSHCHIDFHAEEGMAVVFQVGDGPYPIPSNFPTCGNFY